LLDKSATLQMLRSQLNKRIRSVTMRIAEPAKEEAYDK